jgi:BirA family transcriptional regulator, biotin operon repressor / biotin---[acetyl-CoA-carboxylase] ligase
MYYHPQLLPPMSLVELDTVGSTNDHAKTLARNGYPHGTIVWAHTQTAGRGRQGNSWLSLPGNLFMTVILRPDRNASVTGQLSFVIAVALAEALKEVLPPSAQISLKWPNDLLLNGRKAAGILLETELNGVQPVNWIVAGIGVNVTDAPEGAASLKSLGVTGVEAGHVLERLSVRIRMLYELWLKKGFEPIREEWLRYAHNMGTTINVRLPKETVSGKFVGIDSMGTLQLDLADGTRRDISSGEVFF